MELHLNVLHDLKPEELSKIVAVSKETNKPVSQLILEAARELASRHLTLQGKSSPHDNYE